MVSIQSFRQSYSHQLMRRSIAVSHCASCKPFLIRPQAFLIRVDHISNLIQSSQKLCTPLQSKPTFSTHCTPVFEKNILLQNLKKNQRDIGKKVMHYWINVVSLDHVKKGVEEGITQACHGKKGPLARMEKGDWIVHYSPKLSMCSTTKCQKFTSIGQIADHEVYQFDMGGGFVPFRRKVKYLQDIQEVPIELLLDKLSFTKSRKSWGFMFRFGLFKVPEEDFEFIYNKMVGKEDE